jgi:hypothetical protein
MEAGEALKIKWRDPVFRAKMNKIMNSKAYKKKCSDAKIGIKRPKISERYKGEGNPHYKNGIRTGKRMILEIKQMCEFCGTNKDLHVHHIDKNRQNNQLSNLKLLCRSCHSKEHRGIEWHNMMYQSRLKKMEVETCVPIA